MKSIDIIKDSIKKINLQLKKKDKIIFKNEFQILGPKSNLDSLVIVNLFVSIEEKIKEIIGKEINLLNEDFFDKAFGSKYTLADLQKDLDKKILKKK
jgi:hypothetical protein|tara:strand:- start:2941 stop:3231 length:291 start_codon:yes stop_codon:yes gene_type:complete